MGWLDFEYPLLLKFIGISVILMLFYYLLYAKRATYFQCRVYLLSIIIISAVISTSEIKVYHSEVQVVELKQEVVAEEAVHNKVATDDIARHTKDTISKVYNMIFHLTV